MSASTNDTARDAVSQLYMGDAQLHISANAIELRVKILLEEIATIFV